MPRRNKIEIQINATDNASKVLRGVAGNMQSIGKAATTAIAAGVVVATAAVTGFAVHSLQAFSSFEKGMNEVFTLLPDINEDAMKQMTKDVKMFSSEMKILPDEVIPALYQAISAGVPQANVFDFLTVAQKAAIGGVTDLTTAVDGITSVVNAYGRDVIDATQASDLMFTAVKLGKTDMTQLSAALSQVTPTAAGMGLSFENVSAALATMTAQGINTTRASTAMNGLLAEVANSGTEVGKIFTEVAGKSFRDFIKGGGNLSEALNLLSQAATNTGVPIDEMFGNVRAGKAALALTGANAESFADALDEMASSAGATDAAFERMDSGISRTMDGIRANFRNVAITIGGFLEPLVLPALEDMSELLSGIFTALETGEISFFEELSPTLRPLGRAIGKIAASFRFFFNLIEEGQTPLAAIMSVFHNMFRIDLLPLVTAIDSIFKAIQAIIEPIAQWINENIELESVLIAIGLAIASVVVPAILGIATALGVPLAIFGLLVLAIQGLKDAWESDFLGIRTTITTFWDDTLQPFLLDVQDWFENELPDIIAGLPEIFDRVVASARQLATIGFGILATAADTVHTSIEQVITIIELLIANALNILNEASKTVIGTIKGFGTVIDLIRENIGKWLERNDTLLLALGLLAGAIKLVWTRTKLTAAAHLAWNAAMAAGTVLLAPFNTLVTALGVKLGVANTAALGLKATMAAAVLPLTLIAGAIIGITAAIVKFNDEIRASATAAATVAGEAIAAGRVTEQDVRDRLFAEMQRQLGDFHARLAFPEAAATLGVATPGTDLRLSRGGQRGAAGGRFGAGDIIRTHGLGSGREIFIPGVNGEIQNQAQRTDDASNQRPIQVTINVAGVPTQQQGQQVAFRLVDALRSNGVQVEDSQT